MVIDFHAHVFAKGWVPQRFFDGSAELAANWIRNELLGRLHRRSLDLDRSPVSAEQMGQLIIEIRSGRLSGKLGKLALDEMVETGKDPEVIVAEQGWSLVSDEATLRPLIEKVLAENPEPCAQYRTGKSQLLQFFVGRVMKLSQGQADPVRLQELLKNALEK